MKIFISWSGAASHIAADALKRWLVDFFQAVDEDDVFLSSEDIAKGDAWFLKVMEVLAESRVGILCVTRENRLAPWVLFEAGALAQHLFTDAGRVIPLVLGIARSDLPSPLNELNAASPTQADMLRLVQAINQTLAAPVERAKLERNFNKAWPELDRDLAAAVAASRALAAAPVYDFDVFLSVPMAGWPPAEYEAGWQDIKLVYDALLGCGLKVYWSGEKIDTVAKFQSTDVSANKDLPAIDRSRHFMLVYPKKLATSAIFEAGYAYARSKPARYFTPVFADLPYLMRKLPARDGLPPPAVHSADEWNSYEDLAQLIRTNGRDWFLA